MRNYNAKILLFGEYSILWKGMALALTVDSYSGYWTQGNYGQSAQLLDLYRYLKKEQIPNLDLDRFYEDVQQNWYVASSIPTGYGLGSSGSICAAVYDRYGTCDTNALDALKRQFAAMESFYHGNSSGIDPLTIYCDQPIYFDSVNCTKVNLLDSDKLHFFLLDSCQTRDTKQGIDQFRTWNNRVQLIDELKSLQNQCITHYLNANVPSLAHAFEALSDFELQHLPFLIPSEVTTIWKTGQNSQAYRLKLCGAGGGGFFLGLATDKDQTEQLIQQDLIWF